MGYVTVLVHFVYCPRYRNRVIPHNDILTVFVLPGYTGQTRHQFQTIHWVSKFAGRLQDGLFTLPLSWICLHSRNRAKQAATTINPHYFSYKLVIPSCSDPFGRLLDVSCRGQVCLFLTWNGVIEVANAFIEHFLMNSRFGY